MALNTEELKAKVLDLAIRGKLVDSSKFTGETGYQLVERIKAEREKLVKEKKIKKSKELSSISEDEIPFDIPSNWTWVRLGDITEFINGDRGKNYPSKKDLIDSGIAFINAGHLDSGTVKLETMNYISEEKYNALGSGKVKANDIIYCLRGTLGKCAINQVEIGAIASSLMLIRPLVNEFNIEYLYQFLNSSFGKELISKYDNGSAQPNLSSQNVRLYTVPLPSLDEQKEIMNRIEELFEIIDNLSSQAESGIQTLDQLRQKTLDLAIRGKLVPQDENDEPTSELLKRIEAEREQMIKEKKIKKPKKLDPISDDEISFDIPESWEFCKMGMIGESYIGLTYKPTDVVEKGLPVLRANNIQNGKMEYKDFVYVDLEVKDKLLVRENDLLICSRNGSKRLIGKSALINNNGNVMTFGAFMSVYRSEFNLYVYYFMQSEYFRSQLIDSNTMTVNQLTQGMLRNIIIPLPSLQEQLRIVEKLESLLRIIDNLEDKLKRKIKIIEQIQSA